MAVRKGDVNNEGRGEDAPALSRSEQRYLDALYTLGKIIPPTIIIVIPVAFVAGIGTKLWQRAYRLGRRLA